MEIKKFMTLMVAALAIMMGVSSCGSDDDDEPELALADQVAGSYIGNEVIMVGVSEESNGTATYKFVKSSDSSVDMTIPSSGFGAMTVPPIEVKNIKLTKSGNTITCEPFSYEGMVTNAQGQEKTINLYNVVVMFSEKTVVVTFSLKYGSMPFLMETTFTGNPSICQM